LGVQGALTGEWRWGRKGGWGRCFPQNFWIFAATAGGGGFVSGITLELLKTCIHFTKMCTFSAVRAIAGSVNTMVVSVPDSQALEGGRSLCSMVVAPTRGGWADRPATRLH